jgi:DNA polymerase III subunit delta
VSAKRACPNAEMRPAYLIAGSDSAKIEAARARLRARAEREGGTAALQVFDPIEGHAGPDAAAALAAIPALSLTEERRYLLVDGVDRWRDREQQALADAIRALPPDLTIVMIASGKAPTRLAGAVKSAGGEVLTYEAPRPRELPRFLVAEAARRGFRLDLAAARLLVERMGSDPLRLGHELDRLALWAGEDGEVTVSDLEAMIADTSETAIWSLSDALLERDRARALEIAERLLAQGESLTGIVYSLASRLRRARTALARLERGVPAKQVESELGMHPFAARQLMARVRQASPEDLRRATAALADLEVWSRGGVDYGDELAMTLALRRATT